LHQNPETTGYHLYVVCIYIVAFRAVRYTFDISVENHLKERHHRISIGVLNVYKSIQYT
jgi:hypothetical protein